MFAFFVHFSPLKWQIKNFSYSTRSPLTLRNSFRSLKLNLKIIMISPLTLRLLMEKVWIFWYIQDIKQIYILLHFLCWNINTENIKKENYIEPWYFLQSVYSRCKNYAQLLWWWFINFLDCRKSNKNVWRTKFYWKCSRQKIK